MFRFEYTPITGLPPLAWCVKMTRQSHLVEVCHGEHVETNERFFCEGAWGGPFQAGEFLDRPFFGSGARIESNAVVFATPSHTLERLFVLKQPAVLLVSNSLPLLLATAQDQLIPNYLLYGVHFSSIVNGIYNHDKFIPTMSGNRVELFYYCSLAINDNLEMHRLPKKDLPDFETYGHYVDLLTSEIQQVIANAADSSRKTTFKPLATVSSGYDSPAAAVFAKFAGCTEAVTFTSARGERGAGEENDSGTSIGNALGMHVHEYARMDYMTRQDSPELEFLGYGAQESAWEDRLVGRVLFTGFHGDKVWDKNCSSVTAHVVRGDPSGHSLCDFRLRTGWIHLPVPFLGVTRHASIHKISNSADVARWTLNNGYDRPIPRRLVEEEGVPRGWFGLHKRAVGVVVEREGLEQTLTANSLTSFREYCNAHWDERTARRCGYYAMLRRVNDRYEKMQKRFMKRVKSDSVVTRLFPLKLPQAIRIGRFGSLGMEALLFSWSINTLTYRYQKILKPEAKRRVQAHN